MRDVHGLPNSVATKISKFSQAIVSNFASDYFQLFSTFLVENNITLDENILKKLDFGAFLESNDDLINDTNIVSVLHDHYNFVAPIEITFPDTSDKLYYVPIKETILSVIQDIHFNLIYCHIVRTLTFFKLLIL